MADLSQLSRLTRRADSVAESASLLVRKTMREIRGELANLSGELNLAGNAEDREKVYAEIRRRMALLSRRMNTLMEAQNEAAAKGAAKSASALTGLEVKYSPSRAKAICELVTPAQGENIAAVFTDRMGRALINSLREATVGMLREQAIAGGSMKDMSRDLAERWSKAANMEDPKFTDSSGRVWNTKTYIQMNVRTNTMRVYNDCLADNVARETGGDLMRISTGGDQDCDCAAWEGCIISLTGKTKGFPTYDDARNGGCFHPNCTHTLEYVNEVVDAEEIALQKSHPFNESEGSGAESPSIADAQDERKYEIDQARYMRDNPGMTQEQARVEVDRDNLALSIQSGLVREDAREIVAKMTDAQVTALCPNGNPPAFEPTKGTKRNPEPEKWNHGSAGGVVHIARNASAEQILEVCKVKDAQPPQEPPKEDEQRRSLEEIRAMKIEDALKLKQIDELVPSATTRFDEAERLNEEDQAKIAELQTQSDAMWKLPFAERQKRRDEYFKLVETRKKLEAEAPRRAFERNVAAFGFTENNCTVKTGRIAKSRREIFEVGKAALERLYSADVFPDRQVIVNATREKRSFHQAGELHLSKECKPKTVVHEASHFVEFGNSHVHERCLEFLRYRTAGEDAKPLRELTGNMKYRPDEMARPDKFFNPYCGKDYGDRSTEILSMGVERLTLDPKKFYNTDPEYFKFCVGIIRGVL